LCSRVGRGARPTGERIKNSYCVLLSGKRIAEGSDDCYSRLLMLKDLVDGFKISEADLALRGPGDFFGATQHGFGNLR